MYIALIVFGNYGLHLRNPNLNVGWYWIANIGLALTCYICLRLIFRFLLGLRHIGTLDELQMFDMSTNKTIITAVLFFDKFDADVILERLRSRMLGHRRLRSLFVKMFD